MNVQHSLILEFMLYELKLDRNAVEETKNTHHVKSESAVDQNTVTWNFALVATLNDQTKQVGLKMLIPRLCSEPYRG